MKTLKYLTICFVVCCLFAGNVFAQFHGISFLKQTSDTALVGDPVFVSFLILNVSDQCQDTLQVYSLNDTILNASGGPVNSGPILRNLNWQFQNGAGWDDPVAKNYIIMPFGGIAQSDPYSYYNVQPGDIAVGELIDQAQLGWTDTCTGGLTCGNCATNPEVASASGSTTVAFSPCVAVTKDACPYSKVGDEILYDITISNCGDVDLEVISVIDSLLGDITAEAIGAGCAVLPAQGSCNFQVAYIVQPGDDTGEPGATLVNVVEVNYSDPAQGVWTANDDAVVTLLHPSFTVDVECLEIIDETALFEVTFCNTGDVDLLVDPLDPGILPFTLPVQVDSECSVFVVEEPVQVVCGAASASKTIAPLASIPSEYCELANILPPDPVSDTAVCEIATNPCFTVEKNCTSTGPLTEGDTATYEIIVTNCGDVSLDFVINDASAEPPLVDVAVGPIAPSTTYNTTVSITVPPCAEAGDFLLNNEVIVDAYCADGTPVGQQSDNADCTYSCGGGEGCTPGFWKNSTSCWGCYSTTTKLNQVFDFPGTPAKLVALGNTTLLDALKLPGGTTKIEKAQILMRHAVSAVLNACSGNVEYPDSVAGIVDDVNEILANWSTVTGSEILSLKNQFQDWNELGCPISSENSKNPCQRKNGY